MQNPPQVSGAVSGSFKKGLLYIFLTTTVLLVVTWAALIFELDLRSGAWFFSEAEGWRYQSDWLWDFLYHYGTIPGILLTLAALTVLFIGFRRPAWQSWRSGVLVITLTSILGAGLLVNAILKPYCGRPRPREVIEFNGQWTYCRPCFDSEPGKGMSFPCGHCTMGFLFVTLFYCRRQSKILAYAGTGLGLVLGGLLGVARAAQGAHFFTDIVWALGVIVLVSLAVHYWIIPFFRKMWSPAAILKRRSALFAGVPAVLLAAVTVVFFLVQRPFYDTHSAGSAVPPGIERLVVVSNVDWVKTDIEPSDDDQVRIEIIGQGMAAPDAGQRSEIKFLIRQHTMEVGVLMGRQGYFSELRHELRIRWPSAVRNEVAIEIRQPAGISMPGHLQPSALPDNSRR